MPRFEPFAGVLYDTERLDLAEVTAPPYDVIDNSLQNKLYNRSPYNVVRVEYGKTTPSDGSLPPMTA